MTTIQMKIATLSKSGYKAKTQVRSLIKSHYPNREKARASLMAAYVEVYGATVVHDEKNKVMHFKLSKGKGTPETMACKSMLFSDTNAAFGKKRKNEQTKASKVKRVAALLARLTPVQFARCITIAKGLRAAA